MCLNLFFYQQQNQTFKCIYNQIIIRNVSNQCIQFNFHPSVCKLHRAKTKMLEVKKLIACKCWLSRKLLNALLMNTLWAFSSSLVSVIFSVSVFSCIESLCWAIPAPYPWVASTPTLLLDLCSEEVGEKPSYCYVYYSYFIIELYN